MIHQGLLLKFLLHKKIFHLNCPLYLAFYCKYNKNKLHLLYANIIAFTTKSSKEAIMKEILREIGMIARALDSISNIEFKEYDLTKGQYLYLVRICENPGIIQEKLAELIKVDRTTAARAIKKLEINGFIEKRDDQLNKKIKKLFPTDKGKHVYPFIKRENDYSNDVALDGFSEEEAENIFHLLQRVRKNVEVDWEFVKKGNKRNY
jgi:DNA-binding MarR family transcriptional regulator